MIEIPGRLAERGPHSGPEDTIKAPGSDEKLGSAHPRTVTVEVVPAGIIVGTTYWTESDRREIKSIS